MYKVPRAKDPESPKSKNPREGPTKVGPHFVHKNTPPPPPPVQKSAQPQHPKPNPFRSPAPSLAQRPSSHILVIVVHDSAAPHDVIGRLAAPDLLLVRRTPRPLQAPRERKPTPASATPPPAGGMATRRHARTLWRRDLDAITGDRRPPERPMSGGAPITRPHAPKRGMTTAAREGWQRRALDLLGGDLDALTRVDRPSHARSTPPSTARPPPAADAMHGKELAREHAAHPGGSSPAPPARHNGAASLQRAPGGKRAHRAAMSYRAVQRRHCVT